MKTILLMLALSTVSCAHKYEAKELENQEFETKGSASNGKIGLNEKKQIVIKEETSAEDELRVQEMVNLRFQDRLQSDLHMLKLCLRDLADPRLGGNGKARKVPAVDDMRTIPEVREELGLDEDGNLKIVREQYFEEKLKSERKYEKTLKKMMAVAEEHREECEAEMTQARLKAGLPGDRIMGEGHFTQNGTWVELRKAENNLNDAFELQAMSAAKAKKAE